MALILLTDLQFEQSLVGTAHLCSSWCQLGWLEGWGAEIISVLTHLSGG